ncbi:hypothetical protein pneo_cds_1012 [Pandoravirus neocaledonia]|uniref:Uncharacterized protein n=1 Tax=Pandoravirus neocaledonia TaxID=2107708 RepID=A0A2U7UDR9_9VIRU|nr:hypothetical protein pneo_cds_1012 [Pandoravirus neocaledonia]AVK76619.1 hypothetical protein pneo_cds_1012 [Pandoravirus neocaledonia]
MALATSSYGWTVGPPLAAGILECVTDTTLLLSVPLSRDWPLLAQRILGEGRP